jgi:DNA-directed RNA polymerase subunit H (RpoH/RPB5)
MDQEVQPVELKDDVGMEAVNKETPSNLITEQKLEQIEMRLNGQPLIKSSEIEEGDIVDIIINNITIDRYNLYESMLYLVMKQKRYYLGKTPDELDLNKSAEPTQAEIKKAEKAEEEKLKGLKVGDEYKGDKVTSVKTTKNGQRYVKFKSGTSMQVE